MIKIEAPDLSKISYAFSNDIKKTFLIRLSYINDVLSILKEPNKIGVSDVRGKVTPLSEALRAVLNKDKLLDSKAPSGEGKNTEDLVFTLSKYKTVSDKRSRCRKNIKYKELKKQVDLLEGFVKKNNLFSALPKDLLLLNDELNNLIDFKVRVYNYFFNYVKYYFVLDKWIGDGLDLKCCPYCNRNYITYIPGKTKRVIGPSYDHFFSKTRYKFITISFYNLIPSCYICNSNLKGNIKFKLDTHIHPYLDGFENNALFDFELSTKDYLGDKKICFKPKIIASNTISDEKRKQIFGVEKEKDSGSINVFKLEEVYKSHHDSVEEIHEKFDRNSPHFIGSVSEIINMLKTSEEEFYRFNFRNYFNASDFNKRPLAKLDKDIYDKMKMISEQTN